MELKILPHDFTVCKVHSYDGVDLTREFTFTGKTDDELSLVCVTENTPASTIEREDGWSAFKISGVLDFSLIGILAGISSVLAENKIGIFVISTYNTDYILVKKRSLANAVTVLTGAGYDICDVCSGE